MPQRKQRDRGPSKSSLVRDNKTLTEQLARTEERFRELHREKSKLDEQVRELSWKADQVETEVRVRQSAEAKLEGALAAIEAVGRGLSGNSNI